MRPEARLAADDATARLLAGAQQAGRSAAAGWQARSDVTALAATLAALDTAVLANPGALADRLAPWFGNLDWLDAFFAAMAAALRAQPLAALPFRIVQGRVVHMLGLFSGARADLSLGWVDADALATEQDVRVAFHPAFSVIKVIRAGGLEVVRYRLADQSGGVQRAVANPPCPVEDGALLLIDGRRESLRLVGAAGDAVLLRCNWTLPEPGGLSAYDGVTGTHIADCLADDQVSRMLPLLTLARLCGVPQRAAQVLAVLASDGDPVLRWSAMREWLVADAAAAWPQLQAMAGHDSAAQVRIAAQRTLRLLAPAEAMPCRA